MAVQDVAEIARRLLHVPLFEGLSLDTLEQIVSLSYPKEANAGEFFFNEGDQAENIPRADGGPRQADPVDAGTTTTVAGDIGRP
jgi:hypothetical protein